jgi:hypothetical protein
MLGDTRTQGGPTDDNGGGSGHAKDTAPEAPWIKPSWKDIIRRSCPSWKDIITQTCPFYRDKMAQTCPDPFMVIV